MSMRKIESLHWGFTDVAKLPSGEIRRLCAIIAHGVASLHKGRMIHADLNPDNVLFMKTDAGYTTAKIIDFDSGFLETDPPGPGEPIIGDFNYFWIADRQGRSFMRLNELFAAKGQVGFRGSQRVDGKLILPEAIKVLQQKGTAATGG